jgi:hypothetical protein
MRAAILLAIAIALCSCADSSTDPCIDQLNRAAAKYHSEHQ